MRRLIVAFLLLALPGCGEEIHIAVGQSRDEAVALIEKHGGADITPGLAVVGQSGEWPLKGIYWEFRDYDAVITLTTTDGKVTAMTYWTKKDFGHSKSHRAETARSITVLKLDASAKRVSVEGKKDAG